VAIHKRVKRRQGTRHQDADVTLLPTLPVFSYPVTDALAQVVVNAWANPGDLLKRDSRGNPTTAAVNEATAAINAALSSGLKRAVIITEQEHDDDYIMQDDDEVVFVLPNKERVRDTTPPPLPTTPQLLATAKLLMACTPNGI
jgi:hypothetical protein